MLKAFMSSIALVVIASTSVLAENTLVEVGENNGEIVYLDTESIKGELLSYIKEIIIICKKRHFASLVVTVV